MITPFYIWFNPGSFPSVPGLTLSSPLAVFRSSMLPHGPETISALSMASDRCHRGRIPRWSDHSPGASGRGGLILAT